MDKPVWTLEQIAAHITRGNVAWPVGTPIAYSFYQLAPAHLGKPAGFSPFTAAQREALRELYDLISDISPITFVEVPDNGIEPSSSNRRIAYYNIDTSTAPFWGAAGNYQSAPSGGQFGTIFGAEVVVNQYRAKVQGNWETGESNPRKLLHEALHALGLSHPGSYNGDSALNYENFAEYQQDSHEFTVMSYWLASNTGADHVADGITRYTSTPLLHDVAALQRLYGANMTTRTGDTVYGFNATAGRPAYDIAQNPYPIFTIWDAGGVDTLDLTGYSSASSIDLAEGGFTSAGQMTRNISIAFGAVIENAKGGAGNDTILGNAAANRLEGGGGDDQLDGLGGADVLVGGSGDDLFFIDHQDDAAIEAAGGGTDEVRTGIASYALALQVERLRGTSAAGQTLIGNDDSNEIIGGAGDDVIEGRGGADVLDGGAGADRFVYRSAGDSTFAATDRLRGFETGIDKIDLSALGQAAVTLYHFADESTGAPYTRVEAGTAGGILVLRVDGHIAMSHILFVPPFRGTAGDDVIEGTADSNDMEGLGGDDRLYGFGGVDRMTGGDGNDLLDGGAGADHMDGGAGDDVYVVDDAADQIADGGGSDTVRSSISLRLFNEALEHLELLGSAAINGVGNAQANRITGNDAANYLDGREGADRLTGRGGDDIYVVDDAGDLVVEEAGGGDDQIRFEASFAAASYVLPDDVERAQILGASIGTLFGNASDNRLEGDDRDDRLDGAAGSDALFGGGGDDILIVSGPGTETASGGAGRDLLVVRWGDLGGAAVSTDLVAAGDGSVSGSIASSGRSVAFSGIERFDVTGGAGEDDIATGGGDDLIDGGAGADRMRGGAGDDVYFADREGDLAIEQAGQGHDEVRTTASAYTLGDHVEALTGVSALGQALTGNAGANVIAGGAGDDRIEGGGGADLLTGGAGADRFVYRSAGDSTEGARDRIAGIERGSDRIDLLGLGVVRLSFTPVSDVTGAYTLVTVTAGLAAMSIRVDGTVDASDFIAETGFLGTPGDDFIAGTPGADLMRGGTGNDVYIADHPGDTIDERPGEGDDEVRTGLYAWTLAANVEALTGTSDAGHDFTGNELANRITGGGANDALDGGAGDDLLDGGAGADSMGGRAGDDVYLVDQAGDQVIEAAGEGTDEIRTALASYSLAGAANVETLTGTSNAGQALTGNGRANVIAGGSGNDRIDGGSGGDTMAGGLGDDVYVVDDSGDVVIEAAGEGLDEVRTALENYDLPDNVEYLTGTSLNGQALNGNALDNYIRGGAGNDIMGGGGGTDTMEGGAGNDHYVVNDETDVVIEAAGAGTDRVLSRSASYALSANVENLTGLRSTGQTLIGNELANAIVAGAGHDFIDGGAGADTMTGGLGNDIYVVDDAGDQVVEAAGAGTDEIRTGLSSYSLAANVEDLVGTSASGHVLTGNGLDNRIVGYLGDDTLWGGDGNDTLVGHGGFDTLRGGAGDDTYFIDAGDTIVEFAGEGLDTVVTQAEIFVLTGALENLRAGSDIAHDFRGHSGNNVIVGGAANDMIRAQDGGGDLLFGKGGVDSFYMGGAFANDDFVDGGDNRDSLILQGDYSAGLTLTWNITGGTSIANIESLSLLSGSVTQYGDTAGNSYSYKLTLVDANIAAGALFKVNGFNLRAGENLTFDASAETDAQLQILAGLGTDTLVGGAMGDSFVFGHDGRFGPGDTVNGGGGLDVLYLRGDYTIDFNAAGYAGSLTSVESIALLTSANNEFAGGGDGEFDYVITWNDAMLANGVNMSVNGSRLGANESFVFDGSSETGGNLRVFGGAAADTLTTGGGNDILYGGGGADVLTSGAGIDIFRYQAVSDSTAAAKDTIHGFAKGSDRIDVARIDADAGTAADEAFAFIGSNAFTAAGQLRAFNVSGDLWQVEGDVNGDGTADLVIQVHVEAGQMLGAADLML